MFPQAPETRWLDADPHWAAPMFRTTFVVDAQVRRAEVAVCGLGFHELFLNGQRVGDTVLEPNWTHYANRELRGLLHPFVERGGSRVHYLVHNVTALVRRGDNAIGVMLGNGMYRQTERLVQGPNWFGDPCLILELTITDARGQTQRIVSDASWRCAPSPITDSQLFVGEHVDHRLVQRGWCEPGFEDATWSAAREVAGPSGKLVRQTSPGDRMQRTIMPRSMRRTDDGRWIVDMGVNFSGWVRLRARGPAGHTITLRFAEELDAQGEPDFLSAGGDYEIASGGRQVQTDRFTLAGDAAPETFEPRFVWHAFRYVELIDYPGTPRADDVLGVVVHADLPRRGHFACSDELLNHIQQVAADTIVSAAHAGVPMDCPHRERLGYTGDGHVVAPAALYNFDAHAFYRKWIEDIFDAQDPVTGFVPHTAPFEGGGGPGWGAACVILPWTLHVMTGDAQPIEQHYPQMQRWLDYLDTHVRDGIMVSYEPGHWDLGDWCCPKMDGLDDPAATAFDIAPTKTLVHTYFYWLTLDLLRRMATVLGRDEDATALRQRADAVAAAFHARFFDPDRGCYGRGTHGDDVFALNVMPVPADQARRAVTHLLEHLTVRTAGHLDTGFFGTPLLLDTLVRHDLTDLACRVLQQRTYPGYGHMLERGATTMWELWSGEGSHCHPAFGSVSAFFFRHVAGLGPDAARPGWRHVIVHPRPGGGLTHAEASVRVPAGEIAVRWWRDAGRGRLRVTLPEGVEASVFSPADGRPLGTVDAGVHPFEW